MDMKGLFQGRRPLCLDAIAFPDSLRILVLAPHPDDFDQIGITLRFFRDNGNPIHVAVVSSGASGVEDGFCSPPPLENKTLIRETEQLESCRFFGLPATHLTFLRLQEDQAGHPHYTPQNMKMINDYFLELSPDMVFLPHGNDTNPGHQRTSAALTKIAARSGHPVTVWLNRDPKTIRMRHDLYSPFGDEGARWKASLLRLHRSQHQRNLNTRRRGFDKRILDVNRRMALGMGCPEPYAEVFEIEFRG